MKRFVLKDLPQEERPRERLRKVGINNLSLQELLALVIEKGKKGESVLTVSQNLLAHFGNLVKIKEASIEELQKVRGVGFATACKLQAVFKLGEKALNQSKKYGEEIKTPEDVYNLLKGELGNKKKEYFKLLSLSPGGRLIGVDDISIGTLNASLVHPREVFYPAIKNSASGVILVHNHPSEDPSPSKDDLETTKRIIKVSKIMAIEVLDHVIIVQDKVFSFKRERLI